MSGRDKTPLISSVQQQKYALKQSEHKLLKEEGYLLSDGSITMEEYQCTQESKTKVVQHEGQQDLCHTFKINKHLAVNLVKHRPKPDKHKMLGKYMNNPNPSLYDPSLPLSPPDNISMDSPASSQRSSQVPGDSGTGKLSESPN